MKVVDLTHPWSIHTPGWVGYPGGKLYYTQNLQTNQIVSQRLEVSLHSAPTSMARCMAPTRWWACRTSR
jgi:kynurenine formamidase